MKDYQRLTEEHIPDAEFCSGCSFDDDLNGCEKGGCDKYYMYFETYEKLRKLEDKIESGELGDVKELKKELKAQEVAANAYRIFFGEQKYWREVAERALMNAVKVIVDTCEANPNYAYFYNKFLQQAEKELEEERKDEQS